jgi:hypothetical protein
MRYLVQTEGFIVDSDGNPLAREAFEALLDEVMDELLKLDVVDPDMGATLSSGQVRLGVVVDAQDFAKAHKVGSGQIRSALHAANVATPGWSMEPIRWLIEAQEERRELVDA